MTDGTRLAIGLSVGSTVLAAVSADRAVRRPPVLTVNGATIADFVDRVGDPVGILAPDGSSHRAERLLADTLRDLAYQVTGGRALPPTAITVPAHWRPGAVEALRRAVARVPEWTRRPPMVLTDATAALTALDNDPGLPTRGVVAVCDFGGTGTSITLVDAARGRQRIGETLRYPDFSGDLVDQALLSHVIGELAGAGSLDLNGTSAIGSLWRLRAQCRGAKERLSTCTATALPVQLPDFRRDIRLTRTELDSVLREPLAGLVAVLDDTLQRNGIHPSNVTAVATVGGGAGIAAVTTTLSEHLRVPVITNPRAGLLAATGAALRALRGPADDSATKVVVAAPNPEPVQVRVASAASAKMRALAWSEAPDLGPLDADAGLVEYTGLTSARPELEFEPDENAPADKPLRWYRSPMAVMVAATLVLVGAVSAIGVVLANDATVTRQADPVPSISNAPEAPAVPVVDSPVAVQEPPAQQPQVQQPVAAPRTVIATQAPVTRTQVVQKQLLEPAPQAPPPQAPAPVTSTVTETVSPTPEPTTSQPRSPEPGTSEPSTQPTPEPSTPQPTPEPSTPQQSEPEPDPGTTAAPSPSATPPRWTPTIPPIPTIPGLPTFLPHPGG